MVRVWEMSYGTELYYMTELLLPLCHEHKHRINVLTTRFTAQRNVNRLTSGATCGNCITLPRYNSCLVLLQLVALDEWGTVLQCVGALVAAGADFYCFVLQLRALEIVV